MKRLFKHLLVVVLALMMVFAFACGGKKDNETNNGETNNGNTNNENNKPDDQSKDDDSAYFDLSVRDAKGTHAAVAAANAYATKAGYDILQAGGNAFDAAVAIAFAIGVTEPYASGVGGGGVMTAYNATTKDYVFYNFREFLPGTATEAAYKEKTGDSIPTIGIYSAGVPTEVAGLTAIVDDFGKLPLKKVMEPAIKLAEEGFVVTPVLAENISRKTFAENGADEAVKIFSYKGEGKEDLLAGEDLLIQKDYAKVLKEIAENGAAGFYTGWVAQAIVEASQERGGFITQDDLYYAMENYPKKGEPIHTNYNGYDIYTANTPSSGGIILAEALNMIEHYCTKNNVSLKDMGNNTPEYIHLIGTALQLSFADKRKYVADNSINPATGLPFVDVPLLGLANKEYAAQRFDTIYNPSDTFKKTLSYDWGGNSTVGNKTDKSPYEYQDAAAASYSVDTWEDDNGTTSFSVADSEGNIVSFTQTINHFWGSYIIPEGCGFFLNDQLTSFSFTKGSVHFIAPYKQPVSHIMPTIILKDGKPFATLGSPGSMRIPSAVLQVVLNLIDFNMDIQSAINNKRIHSYCVQSTADTADIEKVFGKSDDPDYKPYQHYKLIYVENIAEDVRLALKEINYAPYNYTSLNNFFGGVQGITFNYDASGNLEYLHGGADPRRDGKALAF